MRRYTVQLVLLFSSIVCFLFLVLLPRTHLHSLFSSSGRSSSSSQYHGITLGDNRNVFVCITGQLSRLELRNKIDKLFLPLHDRGYKLFIGLALTTHTTSRYTNNNNFDKMSLYTSIGQAKQTLMEVSGVVEVRHFSGVNNLRDQNFLNDYYYQSLGNNSNRAQNHANQYQILQSCNQWPGISNQSAFIVRMREDAYIHRMHLEPIISQAQGGAVVTTGCDSWGGINDKMAFGPSRSSDFFLSPYEYYKSLNEVVPNLNPEKVYQHCYTASGYNLSTTNDYSVTKAAVRILRNHSHQGSSKKMCSVGGKPFFPVKINLVCLQECTNVNLSYDGGCNQPSYTAECRHSAQL